MQKNHLYNSDDKLKWFGYGEWVEEPDEVIFEHGALECRALRIMARENDGSMYGGHWCGYVRLPNNHPWIAKERYMNIDCNIHGGITHIGKRFVGNEDIWVGFDCAHCDDVIPSMDEHFTKICQDDPLLNEIKCLYPHLMKRDYKNIDFVEKELKSLASQAKEALKNFQANSLYEAYGQLEEEKGKHGRNG